MRPFPWLLRVSLFAFGFGVGVSHFGPAPTQRHFLVRFLVVEPASKTTHLPLASVSPLSQPCVSSKELVHKIGTPLGLTRLSDF
jgi:hypothetical protein